jgi:hypothetical protein
MKEFYKIESDKKEKILVIERTSLDAILNEGIREQSLRDLIPD